MKKFIPKSVLIMMCVLMAVGCGTIVNGSMQNVIINSTPSSASVWIDGIEMGKTPATLPLKRKDDHTIRLVKEGRTDATLKVTSSINAAFFGNIIFGGLIGCAVDLGTGGCYTLSPDKLTVNLEEVEKSHSEQIYVPEDRLEQIKSIKIVNRKGETTLLVSINWVD